MNILLTGYTGNLGPEIARQLAPHRVLALVRHPACAPKVCGVEIVRGSLENLPAYLAPQIQAIVHGAAATGFRESLDHLRTVNVEGTARLLEFARTCPRLRRFVHLSTGCVAGTRSGLLAEAALPRPGRFVNGYEQSKWEAEQLVLQSSLPIEIARLSIVVGSERDGSVRRIGALHHTLHWLSKGLIPMLPGCPLSSVDLISTEFAARGIAQIFTTPVQPGRVIHLSAGGAAAPLGDLLQHLQELFARGDRRWQHGTILPPDIVNAETFAQFQASIQLSGDVLFRRVAGDAEAFMPGLLHPRLMAISQARELPLPDWRVLTERVLGWLLTHNWGRSPQTTVPVLTYA